MQQSLEQMLAMGFSNTGNWLGQMLEAQVQVEGTNTGMEKKVVSIQPDSPINFLQLSKLDSLVGAGDILDISLNQALGTGRISKADFASSKLNKVCLQAKKVLKLCNSFVH